MAVMSFDEWYWRLCWVEGKGKDWPGIGDDGQAIGPSQQHPSFFAQWYRPAPGQWHDTWIVAFRDAAKAFWMHGVGMHVSDRAMAVGFHLHGQPYASSFDLTSPDGVRYGNAFDQAPFPAPSSSMNP